MVYIFLLIGIQASTGLMRVCGAVDGVDVGLRDAQVDRLLGLCIGAQRRYNIYRKSAQPVCRYFPDISATERSEAAEPPTAPRLVRGPTGGAAGKFHAIWLHFPSKSGNNIDYRIVE